MIDVLLAVLLVLSLATAIWCLAVAVVSLNMWGDWPRALKMTGLASLAIIVVMLIAPAVRAHESYYPYQEQPA